MATKTRKRSSHVPAFVKLFALLNALMLVEASSAVSIAARAATCITDADVRSWTVIGDADSNTDISGAACAPDGRCLLVSDEKRRAWFFRLDETHPTAPKLIIGDKIKLNPMSGDDEADAEGAAFDSGLFYAIGSHGTSRRKKEFQASRYSVYRIEPDGTVQASAALVPLLTSIPGISEHFCTKAQAGSCQPLQEGGANIEGLAARDGNLYIGFRAPSPGGKAFIVRLAEKAIFGQAGPELQTLRIDLGQDESGRDLGIRDIAAVADGFLILAGPSLPEGDDAVGSGKIFHWREGDPRPRLLRELTVQDKGVKPEVLLPMGETATAYRALVMCDGVAGGSAAEYQIRSE
jgi:Protein of unknown function (DUF3616)